LTVELEFRLYNIRSVNTIHRFFGRTVKRGICYDNVCPSVSLSVTLMSHAYTEQDIEIHT